MPITLEVADKLIANGLQGEYCPDAGALVPGL